MKKPFKILIVDDNHFIRVAMRELIEFLYPDCQIAEAANGQIGMERVRTEQPNLIFLDFHMPVMNGYEMALALQQDATLREIPLILYTHTADNNPALVYLKQICYAVLSKSHNSEELEEVLRQLVPVQPQ